MFAIDHSPIEKQQLGRLCRWLVAATAAAVAACIATPLPTPPSVDTERLSLTQADAERVTLVGEERAVQVDGIARLRVSGARAWTEVPVSEFGAFTATLPGQLADIYYLEAIIEDEDLFLIALSTPSGGGGGPVEERDSGTDRDGDGSPDAVDCAPDDASRSGRRCEAECTTEICDGLDNDCDGEVDEGCDSGADADGDGFEAPLDCDDMNPSVNPSAPEICNWLDDDCDGSVDEECEGCASDDECPADATCVSGICTCGPGLSLCGFECVDTEDDDENCGVCGHSCGTDESCVAGECQS